MTVKVPTPAPGERGYLVNLDTGTVHLRYAPHAGNVVKTSTPGGVLTLLGDTKLKACKTCFPWGMKAPPNLEAPSRGQARRGTPPKVAPGA